MADDSTTRIPADTARINMSVDREVRYWTAKFGCTKAKLVFAVGSVGPIATKIQAYLKRRLLRCESGVSAYPTGP